MVESIEDFVNSLPVLEGYSEAEKIYREAEGVSVFPRVELEGSYDLSKAGVQMVYLLGRGKTMYDGVMEDSLIYFSRFVTKDFFSTNENCRQDCGEVKYIALKRINKINLVEIGKSFLKCKK